MFQEQLKKYNLTSEEIIKFTFKDLRTALQRPNCPIVRIRYFGKFEVRPEYLYKKIRYFRKDRKDKKVRFPKEGTLLTLNDYIDLYNCKITTFNAVKQKNVKNRFFKLDYDGNPIPESDTNQP